MNVAFAADILPSCADSGNCQADDFLELFVNIYKFGLEILAPIAVLFFVIGGIVLLTAAGYSERVKRGQQIMSQAAAGVIVVLLSWVIIDTMVFTLTGDTNRTVFGSPWYQGSIWNPECAPILREGCSGGDVQDLQEKLLALGYSVGATGADELYGPQTTAAVRHFQQDYNSEVLTINACSACQVWNFSSVQVWRTVFGREYGIVCGPRTPSEGIEAWCILPACRVTSQEANAKILPTDGAADETTIDALDILQPVATQYQDVCLSE